MSQESEPKSPNTELEIDDSTDIVPRRHFLTLAGAGLLTIGFGSLAEGIVGRISEPINQQVESLIFQPQQLIPEFPITAIEPDKLIVNSFRGIPTINPDAYRLIVDGQVNNTLSLSLKDLQKLPFTSMVIRHVCVEGWAAIVQWGGVRLRDLLAIAKPLPQSKYVYFYSADGYYESWDLDSVLHPQTLMAYQKNSTK